MQDDPWPEACAIPVDQVDALLNRASRPPLIEGREMLAGRTVAVTGAGGTVGAALCRLALAQGARRVLALDHSEYALFALGEALGQRTELELRLASVTDATALRAALAGAEIDGLFHAAAYKHVGLVEANPAAGLANNVLGTQVAAAAARQAGVGRFVLVSTDKAARPVGVMGASKRMAEIVVQDMAARSSATVFSIVRFGNVFGSSGSVVPRFARQIASGGPVTLSDPGASRYFVTLREAAEFVLLASRLAGAGEVLTLDMGPPVPIRDLAERMIRAACRDPGRIAIRTTGLGPGERLHEDPARDGESLATQHPRLRRIAVPGLSQHETAQMLRDLARAIATGSETAQRDLALGWTAQRRDPATPDEPVRTG